MKKNYLKKAAAVTMAAVMAFTMAACGSSDNSESDSADGQAFVIGGIGQNNRSGSYLRSGS